MYDQFCLLLMIPSPFMASCRAEESDGEPIVDDALAASFMLLDADDVESGAADCCVESRRQRVKGKVENILGNTRLGEKIDDPAYYAYSCLTNVHALHASPPNRQRSHLGGTVEACGIID